MNAIKNNFLVNPSRKTVVILILVWLIGIGLSVLSMTDLFREPFFSKENTSRYTSMIGSTIFVFIICFNYCNSTSKKFITSTNFPLIIGTVICISMMFKSLLEMYANLVTIGTSSQWKFYVSLIATIGLLFLLITIVYKGVKKDLFRLKKI